MSRTAKPHAVSFAALALAVMALAVMALAACSDARPDRAPPRPPRERPAVARPARQGVSLVRVTYELAFTDEGTTPIPDGFRVRTTTGDELEVRRATVTSLQAALVPCAPHPPRSTARGATMGLLRDLFTVGHARAGHTELADPSTLVDPRIEPMTGASVVTWGSRTFARETYCRAEYVATRATTPETAGTFDQLATLHVELEAHPHDGSASQVHVAHVTFASGSRASLTSDVELDETIPAGEAVIRIERDLGRAFRDVDFTRKGREFERSVLRGLADATRIRVQMRSPSAE